MQLESLQQENEALKTQMSRLSTHLIDVRIFPFLPGVLPVFHRLNEGFFFQTLQAQLVGLLPPSPLRMPRGQNPGEDAENAQVQERLVLSTLTAVAGRHP